MNWEFYSSLSLGMKLVSNMEHTVIVIVPLHYLHNI